MECDTRPWREWRLPRAPVFLRVQKLTNTFLKHHKNSQKITVFIMKFNGENWQTNELLRITLEKLAHSLMKQNSDRSVLNPI
jgi:hypothetical protein